MGLQELAIQIQHLTQLHFRLFRWEGSRKSSRQLTIRTKQGVFTVSSRDQVIAKSLYCYGEFELDLMSKVTDFLRSNHRIPPKGQGTLLDIGANNGITSIHMLKLAEMERAIAIEPEPENFTLLERNISQNGLTARVRCLQYAASDSKGELSFELSNDNFGDHRVRAGRETNGRELYNESNRSVITVHSDRVDDIVADLPDAFVKGLALVWIDVQGYEGYVFRGARKLLSTGVSVVSEIWPYGIRRAGMSKEQFCEIVQGMWSAFSVLRRGRFVEYPITMFEVFFDELGYENYYDNVIFMR